MAETEKKTRKPTALKRDGQSEKKRQLNKAFKSKVKTAIKECQEQAEKKEDEGSLKTKFNLICSLMDKGVKKGIFKLNKASRIKSNMVAFIQKAKG